METHDHLIGYVGLNLSWVHDSHIINQVLSTALLYLHSKHHGSQSSNVAMVTFSVVIVKRSCDLAIINNNGNAAWACLFITVVTEIVHQSRRLSHSFTYLLTYLLTYLGLPHRISRCNSFECIWRPIQTTTSIYVCDGIGSVEEWAHIVRPCISGWGCTHLEQSVAVILQVEP